MGEKLVGLNRLLHTILGLLACVALGGMVFTAVFIAVDRAVNRESPGLWSAWAAAAPELLLTLAAYAALGLVLRFYARIGVGVACDYFPHDADARGGAVFLFDLLALSAGAALLYFGLVRVFGMPAAVSWAWWRFLSVPLAGLMFVFDAVLLLAGLARHGDDYASRRLPAYQHKLRRSERLRKLREEEQALRAQESSAPEPKPEARDSLWSGMGRALPSHSARLYLLNKQE